MGETRGSHLPPMYSPVCASYPFSRASFSLSLSLSLFLSVYLSLSPCQNFKNVSYLLPPYLPRFIIEFLIFIFLLLFFLLCQFFRKLINDYILYFDRYFCIFVMYIWRGLIEHYNLINCLIIKWKWNWSIFMDNF